MSPSEIYRFDLCFYAVLKNEFSNTTAAGIMLEGNRTEPGGKASPSAGCWQALRMVDESRI